MSSYDFAGKTVLVTGGSMGIGAAFARELDRRGARLVLVARSEKKLAALAGELRDAQWIASDLGAPGGARAVFDEATRRGIAVDVLVNNAGFGVHGAFATVPVATQRDMVDLNVASIVELTHLFLPGIEARRGALLFVASVAGYGPIPFMATYGATKAFVLSFGEALWAEYLDRGVRVLTVSPGATDTPFFERSGEAAAAGNAKAKPEDVVRLALDELAHGRSPSIVHGFSNRMLTQVGRFFSRAFVARLARRIVAPPALPAPG
jgi:short-subunit dehydrogenase